MPLREVCWQAGALWPLSCIKNAVHFPRHSAIYYILKRSLTRIGLPSVLEPIGLTKSRRPDGLTLTPRKEAGALYGTRQLWTPLQKSLHSQCRYTRHSGSVATDAETDKCEKYNDLLDNYYFQPVAIETTVVYGKSTAPFLTCLAKKLVDISGDPRERQCSTSWRWGTPVVHQRLSPAVVRGNTASILACVQAWSDFNHPQCFNQCSCPSLASLQCIAIAFRMSVFSVSFIVFSMFFTLSVKPLCTIALLPFSAILTNLILFLFLCTQHYCITVYCKTFL